MLARASHAQLLSRLTGVIASGALLSAPNLAQTCCEPAGLDVVAWWSLDEIMGTFAGEHTGLHSGTHVGAPTPAAGQVQGALSFDGVDDYVSVPDSSAWTFVGDFTIELWARWDIPVDPANPVDAFAAHDVGGGDQVKWIFMMALAPLGLPGGPFLTFHINFPGSPNGGNGLWPVAPFAPSVDRWYHVAVTRDDSTFSFFVDGVLMSSAIEPALIQDANAPLTLGQAEGGNFMNGQLDEIAIYNRALSPEELQAIAAAGPIGKCGLADCNANGIEDEFDSCGGSSPDANSNGIPDECESESYCTAGISASGCTALLSTTGLPSATAVSGFSVTATGGEGAKDGLFFFGVNGRQAVPWGTGFQCVVPPVKRTPLIFGPGTSGACDGLLTVDLNEHWCPSCTKPTHNPGWGTVFQVQAWYRDPWNTATNKGTTLSDALELTVGP
jgi:hypothetical protein